MKRGRFVPAHLHLNVTYLLEADDTDPARRYLEKVTVPNVILLVFCGSRKNHLTNPKMVMLDIHSDS